MKKLICILMCMLVLIGCSNKKEENTNTDESNQSETVKDNQKEDQSKPDYDTYPQFTAVKTEEGSWYYDVPYLNEITYGLGTSYVNSTKWWLCYSLKINEETTDLDIGYEQSLDAFYKSAMHDYFQPLNGEFIPEIKEKVNIAGLDMYKIEGYAQNEKRSEGNEANCWIYGYTFIIGTTPCGMFGITFEENTEETRELIAMYVDNMVKSLRIGR